MVQYLQENAFKKLQGTNCVPTHTIRTSFVCRKITVPFDILIFTFAYCQHDNIRNLNALFILVSIISGCLLTSVTSRNSCILPKARIGQGEYILLHMTFLSALSLPGNVNMRDIYLKTVFIGKWFDIN